MSDSMNVFLKVGKKSNIKNSGASTSKKPFTQPAPAFWITVMHWLEFFTALAISIIEIAISGNVFHSNADMVKALLSVPHISFIAAGFFMVFFLDRNTSQEIMRFDGSQDSYRRSIKCYRLNAMFNLFAPFVLSFIYTAVLFASATSVNVWIGKFGALYITLFSSCLIPTFFYSLWQNGYDKWTGFVPMREKQPQFKITTRIMFTIALIVVGISAGVMVSLCKTLRMFALDRSIKIAVTFVKNWSPHLILSIVFSVLNMFLIVPAFTLRVKEVNELTRKMANGDYTNGPLVLKSRDEFGILFKNINGFSSSTRNLLQGVHSNVNSTVALTDELNANVDNQSANVEESAAAKLSQEILNESTSLMEASNVIQNIAEQTEGSKQVLEAINSVNESSEKTNAVLGVLKNKINKFKLAQ